MIGGAKGIGLGIDLGLVNQYNRTGSQSYIEPEVLDSLVGVWSAYGMTNDSPNRSTIKNKLSNKGGDFVISNAAFKLNSGFGKYEEDFTTWYGATGVLQTYSKIEITDGFKHNWVINKRSGESAINSFKVLIKGIPESGYLQYRYFESEDATKKSSIDIYEDGEYSLPNSTLNNLNDLVGFQLFAKTPPLDSKSFIGLTITQIPSFEGAFVTDGIDDLITSTKTVQEMLGGSNEITVVSMIHQIDGNVNYTNGYTNYIRHGGGFIRNSVSGINGKGFNKTGIYGYTSTQLNSSNMGLGNVINNILGDKDDYSFERSSTYTLDDAKYSVQNFVNANNQPSDEGSSVAWYWTIIANKVLTTDQINQVIAYFNLDRTLKSDIYCNIAKQGITNENHAEFGDKLIDFSGNGRDIQMYNLAWGGNSGIGNYATNFNDWQKYDNSNINNNSYSLTVTGYFERSWLIWSLSKVPVLKVKISGIAPKGIVYYTYPDNDSYKSIELKKDGIYTLPAVEDNSRDIGFRVNDNALDWIGLTITQIPSHAGALCLDGVDDFGKVTGMPIYKDYTFIAEREILSVPDLASTGSLVSKAYEFNKGAFIVEDVVQDYAKETSFSNTTDFTDYNTNRSISYQSKYSYNGKALTAGQVEDRDVMWLGTIRDNDNRFINAAIYSLMSSPYSMSEFLIERQLKKHKLGTLYQDMVEFRPVIKQDNRIKSIKYYIDGKTANIGQYYPIGTGLGIAVETVQPYMVKSLKVNGVKTIPNADYKVFNARLDSKSPQKITMDIQVDSSLVQWNPVVESNVPYKSLRYYNNVQGTEWKQFEVGEYLPIGSTVLIRVNLNGSIDELSGATSSQLKNIQIGRNGVAEYDISGVLTSESPQKINITIDEYIRYEDIVQPYPVLLRFNDENGNEVSWGGKFRVGSTITRIGSIADPERNLLNGLYSVSGLSLNGKAVTSSTSIVEKQMVFKTTATWLLGNNEPKCILSPSRLRMPNSSYKILGYIPDISGHGNHGVIHNSAYAEGSGVNEDGSYQFDGVNDHVTIPTVTGGGKQVLMKVNNNTINSMLYDQRSASTSPNSLYNDFAIYCTNSADNNQIAYQSRLVGKTYIDGILNTNITCENLLGVLHNITITCDIVVPNNGVVPNIGRGGVLKDLYSKVALYDFMLFDNISTDDKIKELNEYIGIEAKVELPPYYWDAYGKTNLDVDRSTIQQRGIAEGDYDLTNYNHAYDKMSGYGGYEFDKFTNTSRWIETKRENGIEVIEKNDYSFTAKRVGTGEYFWDFKNNSIRTLDKELTVKAVSNNNVSIRWEFKYRTAEKPDTDTSIILVKQVMTPNVPITVTLPYKTEEEQAELGVVEGSTYYLFYFDPSDIPVNEEYTVEMLPLYPNGLVYDGVTDYSENTNIPALTDYTYIVKREFKSLANAATIAKSPDKLHGGAFVADYNGSSQFSFGQQNDILPIQGISWKTKNSFNGTAINSGTNTDDKGITIGRFSICYANMVFYKLILYPKTIPLLQINFLKNLMERDEIIDLNNPIFIKE